MDLIFILLILLISIFLISVGLSKNSPVFAIAGAIGLIIVSGIIVVDGIGIGDGKSGTYTMNVTLSASKISGNITSQSETTYTTYNNGYSIGLSILLALVGLRVTQKVLTESNNE